MELLKITLQGVNWLVLIPVAVVLVTMINLSFQHIQLISVIVKELQRAQGRRYTELCETINIFRIMCRSKKCEVSCI